MLIFIVHFIAVGCNLENANSQPHSNPKPYAGTNPNRSSHTFNRTAIKLTLNMGDDETYIPLT